MSALRHTPLHATHRALGARLVEFAGFEMPVQYTGILDEHATVRERAGVFDVSHMGQIHFRGPEANATVERLVTCRVDSLAVGQVRYGLLCNDAGGVVDDVTLYRTGEDSLFLCVNAANIDKDREWIEAHSPPGAGVADESDATALLALQGPEAAEVLAAAGAAAAADLGRFRFASLDVAGASCLVSRTGYTGSDGFEIYLPAERAVDVFSALLEKGGPLGARACGLGARDTLRLEAALPLYGHELDDEGSPLEAGLSRFVKRKRGGFIGAEAIERRAGEPDGRRLVGFHVTGRGVARADYPIVSAGREVGTVTSGAPSPTLGLPIGLGYVPEAMAEPDTALAVRVRGRDVDVLVVETPFVRKASAGASA